MEEVLKPYDPVEYLALNQDKYVRFEVFTTVTMKNGVFRTNMFPTALLHGAGLLNS
jgi:hypothetical protein